MREDMFKVIVERPRWGSRMPTGDGRLYRESEDMPRKIGMRQGYVRRKSLNENLNPLKRWLASQVNRPWDKVYAELCANIDRRSTVQEHIFAHIDDFVERDTRLVEGKVVVMGRYPRKLVPVEQSWAELYVHPVTGILRANKKRVAYKRQQRATARAAAAAHGENQRMLSATLQLHKQEGVWYQVTLAAMDAPVALPNGRDGSAKFFWPKHWDALERKMVNRESAVANALYGRENVYAASKRQLSRAELKKYQLNNDNAGDSRRFFWLVLPHRVFFARVCV